MLIGNTLFHVKEHFVNEPKALIIITHGIAQHLGYYDQVATTFNKANFDVVTYDVRGHGRTNAKRGVVDDFHEFVSDLHQIVNHYQKDNSQPIFLIGHSMGAVITNAYAMTYQDVAGIISAAGPVRTPSIFLGLTGFFTKLMPNKKILTNFDDENLSYKGKMFETDPYALKYFTLKMIRQILVKGVNYNSKNVKKLIMPALFIHGEDDKLVNFLDVQVYFKRIASTDKQFILYPHTKHNVFDENQTNKIIADIIIWLESRLK